MNEMKDQTRLHCTYIYTYVVIIYILAKKKKNIIYTHQRKIDERNWNKNHTQSSITLNAIAFFDAFSLPNKS